MLSEEFSMLSPATLQSCGVLVASENQSNIHLSDAEKKIAGNGDITYITYVLYFTYVCMSCTSCTSCTSRTSCTSHTSVCLVRHLRLLHHLFKPLNLLDFELLRSITILYKIRLKFSQSCFDVQLVVACIIFLSGRLRNINLASSLVT